MTYIIFQYFIVWYPAVQLVGRDEDGIHVQCTLLYLASEPLACIHRGPNDAGRNVTLFTPTASDLLLLLTAVCVNIH